MIELTPDECRVLGTLIEKAQTTPAQYPLTLNALAAGASQKSNRDPVLTMDDDAAQRALDSLRAKGLAREVMLAGSRVPKHKHTARDALGVATPELVVLAELLLRGPQSAGELRSRASRMHPLESLEDVQNVLANLMDRDPPLVRELPPAPGSRARRYAQLLCPDLHPLESPREPDAGAPRPASADASEQSDVLHTRLIALEAEVAQLKKTVRALADELGVQIDS